MKNRNHAAASSAVMAALVLTAMQAHAQGFYFEADVGQTSFDIDKDMMDEWAEVPPGQSSIDSSDMNYSLAAGYRFSPYFAVEALYVELGESTYSVEDQGVSAGLKLKSNGPAVALAGIWPINATWSLEGRIGAYFGNTSLSASISDGADALEVPVDSKSTPGILLDAGIVAAFADRWALRLGYTHFDKATAISGEDFGLDLDASAGRFLLGVRYSF
jgi:opacity protein-like surface antigen